MESEEGLWVYVVLLEGGVVGVVGVEEGGVDDGEGGGGEL